jgi:hypothetical protein
MTTLGSAVPAAEFGGGTQSSVGPKAEHRRHRSLDLGRSPDRAQGIHHMYYKA